MSHKKPDVAASWRKVKTRVVLYSVAVWMSSTCSVLQAQNDEYLFKTYCAICHESSAAGEAGGPETRALKLMTPEHILQGLETGAMKAQAAERSRVQRRVLAEYLSGKALGNASVERISRSAFWTNAAQRFTNALDGTGLERLARRDHEQSLAREIPFKLTPGPSPMNRRGGSD